MYKALHESPLGSELQSKAVGIQGQSMSLDQRVRTSTRKPSGVMTRLGSKRMDSYQSQKLWSPAPIQSMIQKPGKVPNVEGGSFRNSLPKLMSGTSRDSLFSVSLESYSKPSRFWK